MKSFLILVAMTLCVPTVPSQDTPVIPWFGNANCPACAKEVDKKLFVEHDGQKVFVCGRECQKSLRKDAAAAFAKAYPADKVIDVKNEVCPVQGKPVAEGKTVVFQNHKVRLCCDRCVTGFKKEPNRFLAVAKNKDLKVVGNQKCPVMPDDAVLPDMYIQYKGHLVGLCCDSCFEDFVGDPAKFMKAAGVDMAKPGTPAPSKGGD